MPRGYLLYLSRNVKFNCPAGNPSFEKFPEWVQFFWRPFSLPAYAPRTVSRNPRHPATLNFEERNDLQVRQTFHGTSCSRIWRLRWSGQAQMFLRLPCLELLWFGRLVALPIVPLAIAYGKGFRKRREEKRSTSTRNYVWPILLVLLHFLRYYWRKEPAFERNHSPLWFTSITELSSSRSSRIENPLQMIRLSFSMTDESEYYELFIFSSQKSWISSCVYFRKIFRIFLFTPPSSSKLSLKRNVQLEKCWGIW